MLFTMLFTMTPVAQWPADVIIKFWNAIFKAITLRCSWYQKFKIHVQTALEFHDLNMGFVVWPRLLVHSWIASNSYVLKILCKKWRLRTIRSNVAFHPPAHRVSYSKTSYFVKSDREINPENSIFNRDITGRNWGHPNWPTGNDAIQHGGPVVITSKMADWKWHHRVKTWIKCNCSTPFPCFPYWFSDVIVIL